MKKSNTTRMTTKELDLERSRYFKETNGGISLPAAGFIYWLILGISGSFLEAGTWALFGFFTSGLIFPLGLLLSKPLNSNLMVKGPLSGLALHAMTSIFLSWPMIIIGYHTDVSLTPLFLAIGMSLHWPVIGWMYACKACLIHAITRVSSVTILWFVLPEYRYTIIPDVVSSWSIKHDSPYSSISLAVGNCFLFI